MTESHRKQTMYVSTGNPETVNEPPARATLGQLGKHVTVRQPGPAGTPGTEEYRDKTYQYVQVDSQAPVSPYKGAVAWWSDPAKKLVTTDANATSRNNVAGVFQGDVTVGYYCYIQKRGPATVKFTNAEAAIAQTVGNVAIPSATDGKAEVEVAGTAPTYTPLGTIVAGVDGGISAEAIVDLALPEIP